MIDRKQNPQHSKKLYDFIHKKSQAGNYRINLNENGEDIKIDVFPEVFPPSSDISFSTKALSKNLKDVSGKEVLDIGTGTGIEAIIAAKMGAKQVDAVDVSCQAITCAIHNVKLNNLEKCVSVFESDIFSNIRKKYDIIIANLPFIDCKVEKNNINIALYDYGFMSHKKLFKNLKKYLKKDGYLIIPHANIQSKYSKKPQQDFVYFERLLSKYNLKIKNKVIYTEFDHDWAYYKVIV